jgi:hypothetical protein
MFRYKKLERFISVDTIVILQLFRYGESKGVSIHAILIISQKKVVVGGIYFN